MIWDEDDPRFNALMRLAQTQEGMPATLGSPELTPEQEAELRFKQQLAEQKARGGPAFDANIPKEQSSGLDKLLSSVGNAVMTGKTTGGPGFSDTLNKRGKYLKNFGK